MKRLAIGLVLAVTLSACATVEMAPVQSGTLMSQSEIQDRSAVKLSARKLSSVFSTEGWSRINPSNRSQSAVNILVRGLKKTGKVIDPVRNYLTRRSESDMITADISRADEYVVATTISAREFLKNNPSAADVGSELSDLETALLSARQAEAMFQQALAEKGVSGNSLDMARLSTSVDQLRDVTDAYGVRLRGSSAGAS